MTAQTDALDSLKDRFRRRSLIEDALAMLYWDRSTLMPDGAADARTDQIAELTRMAREILVAAETSDLLDQAEQATEGLAPLDVRDLHLMRRAFLLKPPFRLIWWKPPSVPARDRRWPGGRTAPPMTLPRSSRSCRK